MRTKTFYATILALAARWAALPLDAAEVLPANDRALTAQLGVYGASVSGFLQTPMGGAPGTSDPERPTLDELGIDSTVYYDVAIGWSWDRYTAYAGAQLIQMSESGTLANDLTSRTFFSAGSPYNVDVDFDWYRFGVAGFFWGREGPLVIAPKVELAILDFNYVLSTPDAKADRAYAKPALRLGVEALARPWERVTARAALDSSLPFSDSPMITTASAEVGYGILTTEQTVSADLFAGIGWMRIDYEDDQTLPNHIRFSAEPFVNFGVRLGY